jgi:hypothetical protein
MAGVERQAVGVDETLEVQKMAKRSIRGMWKDVEFLSAGEQKDMVKHIMQSEGDSKLHAMLSRAKAEPGIAITPEPARCRSMALVRREWSTGPPDGRAPTTRSRPADDQGRAGALRR